MSYRIGIDVGGTNIRIGKVDDNGKIVEMKVEKSYGTTGEVYILDTLFRMLDSFDLSDCRGIGVGFCGSVDPINQTVSGATNVVGIDGVPVGKMLKERYGLPVVFDNDANVAGLAEAVYGAGRGKKAVYYITHSTGIGGAFVIDNELYKGRSFNCGEIGSFVLKADPKTRIEPLDAGPGILKKAQETGLEVNTTKEVFEKFKEGNELAIQVIDNAFKDFAIMLANITFTIDPDCYVIGGGVSNNFDLYYPIMKKYYDYYTWGELRDTPILKAELLEPGVIGAALLVK